MQELLQTAHTRQRALRRTDRRIAWGLFVAFLLLYLSSFSTDSDLVILGNDVVPYARQLSQSSDAGLWNPHHLLFHVLAGLLLPFWGLFQGGETGVAAALDAQRLLGSAGAAGLVSVLYIYARNFCRRPAALCIAGLMGVSAGNWLYGGVGETYQPATFALALLLTQAIEMRLGRRPIQALPIMALLVLAVLLRQDSVLVVPVLCVILPWRTALWGVVWAGACSFLIYAMAWYWSGTELELMTWLRGLSESGRWGHAPDLGTIGLAFAFVLCSLSYMTWFAHDNVQVLAALLLACGALCAAFVPPRRATAASARVILALLGFALLRTGFFAWWQPTNLEYHTGTLLPLLLAAPLWWNPALEGRLGLLRDGLLVTALAMIAAGNWHYLIAPGRSESLSERAQLAIELAGEDGLVVALDPLQYYALVREDPVTELYAGDPHVSGSDEFRQPIEPLRARVLARLEAGGRVVLVRDVVLSERFDLVPWTVRPEALGALIEGLEDEPRRDEQGRVWAIVLGLP